MTNIDSLGINPTLRMTNGADQDGQSNWRIHYFTPQNVQCTLTISASLAKVLFALQDSFEPQSYLTQEALDYLIAQQIVVPRSPKPVYRCALPTAPLSNLNEAWALNPNFTLFRDQENETQLRKYNPWGGISEQYTLNSSLTNAAWDAAHSTCEDTTALGSLLNVGYLATKESIETEHQNQLNNLQRWQQNYEGHKKTIIETLVSDIELESLQHYCQEVLTRGFLDGDFGVAGKQRSHVFDDPELKWLLERGAKLASQITQIPLVPSYSFLAFYHQGGVLPPHRDKAHCNISMSLAINVPEDISNTWPLEVEDPMNRCAELYWATGSTLLFDGHHYRHGRAPMPQGNAAVYLILHFKLDPEYI